MPYWVALEMEKPDPALQATLRAFGRELVTNRHQNLEHLIGDGPYLAGDRPTLADAVLIGVARWAEFHQAIDPSSYPRLQALRRRIEADPAVRFALAIEDGVTPTPAGNGAFKGHVALAEVARRSGS